MNIFTSQLPKPCLSKQDEEYLQRNQKWADKHPYWIDILFLIIFFVILGSSVSRLITTQEKNTQEKKTQYSEIGAFVISIIAIIYISIHLDVKGKVGAIRKIQIKCPKK